MNIKKDLFNKENFKKVVVGFLNKRGFYIMLLTCIGMVAMTAVYVTRQNNVSLVDFEAHRDLLENSGLEPIEQNLEKAFEEEALEVTANNENIIEEVYEETENKISGISMEEPIVKSEEEVVSKETPEIEPAQSFIMPVNGQITLEFAHEHLIYSKTLNEWRTHSGIDIAGERGTNVMSAADGVVSEVRQDPNYGKTIVIKHKNNIKTVYANLASTEMVSVGKEVKQGDIIGAIGNTAKIESLEPPHLHFEILKDGKHIDPAKYLDLNNKKTN